MLIEALKKRLALQRELQLYRQHGMIESREDNHVIVNGAMLKNFCNNDYLALSTHPDIKKAFVSGIEKWGVGSGSSVAICGYYAPQRLLEEAFAEYLNRDAAIFFNSGYHANLSVITTLCNRHSTVIADKLCHASLIDAIQLSRAIHRRFQHNDVVQATEWMNEQSLVVTESVFSMEGDISPVDKLAASAVQAKATLMVDDAHGVGVLGQKGRGIADYFGLSQTSIPCLVTPLGKAMGGVGAMVSGSSLLIEGLRQFGRTYHYTTALPPSIAHTLLATLKIIQTESWRRDYLQNLIQIFIKHANARGLPLISSDPTPIKSILVKTNANALLMQKIVREQGFLVSCIRPPTVPEGTARIRISLNSAHEEADIIRMLDIIAGVYESFE